MSTASNNAELLRNANIRLCRLCLWSNFKGLGFNLESSPRPPHIIRLVASNSPAAAGGLKILDVILAVNRQDVSEADYNQVLIAIKTALDSNNSIELLVVEQHFYHVLKKSNLPIDPSSATVINISQTMPDDYLNFIKYQPRTCNIRVNKLTSSFGFEIVNGEDDIGVYIQEVYSNTPASQTSLRKSDRIIEINDKFVDKDTTISILEKLSKAKRKGLVKLYVMDVETYTYYQLNKISLTSKKDRNNKTQTIKHRASFDDKYTSRSMSSLLSEEDIRLCTINRADTADILGLTINYHKKEQFHSLSISAGRNNGPSNAQLSGISNGDYLIEINGQNVEDFDHEQVKQCLLVNKHLISIQMLVTDILTYNYYKQQNDVIHRGLPTVKIMPSNNSQEYDSDDNESLSSRLHSYEPNGTIRVRKRDYMTNKNCRPSINICKGDLIAQQTDVIVVCSSSQYLFDNICTAGGSSVSDSYNAQLKKNLKEPIIAVRASGKLASKTIYFLSWKADSDTTILRKSIEKFVSDAIEKAAIEKYQTIAFPTIGCGKYGCSINLIAQTMIEEADRQLLKHSISVLFVIQSDRMDIYDEFHKQIQLLQSQKSAGGVEAISTVIGKGTIEVEEGDITTQKVDVIISSSSSEMLRKTIIRAAGRQIETAYENKNKQNPNSIVIATPPGALNCKQIFFIKWQPCADEEILQQSLIDLISTVIQNMISYNFTSIAFPAIGCGQHGCSIHVVVKTMVREMKTQLIKRNLSWIVKFVIQSNQPNIYDEFCKQVLATRDDLMDSQSIQIPSTWGKSTGDKIRFVLSTISDEYKSILSNFDQAMNATYTQIIQIERIQNERWYMQYLVHSKDFKRRLNIDSEKRLYHGCPEQAANSIIGDCFNRSFAGVNGTAYGFGVYFSSDATYSHTYTRANANGERCMFVARVLIGQTTKGDSSMKTRPVGFDSTTDNKHIFVTYHDAQAFAEYLITYK